MNHNKMYFLDPDSALREIDIHFGRLMRSLSGGKEEVFIASCLVSKATRDGHVCLDLSQIADKELHIFVKNSGRYEIIKCPKLKEWCNILYKSKVVGKPGDYKPLILDDKYRLYLYRYWNYERILIEELKKRSSQKKSVSDVPFIKNILFRLFPYKKAEIDLQMASALIPLNRNLCIISGGPGTGKTSTVAKILALLIACSDKKLRIFLSAPTGKASMRLKQAITEIKEELYVNDSIKNAIPTDAFTIHRMLKPVLGTPYFKYNSENRLPADLIVVDEASMVDLPLMSKLIQAIPDNAILILLGDKNQLSSVEPGSVLGDICAGATGLSQDMAELFYKITGNRMNISPDKKPPINDCIIELKKSYRFSKDSGIANLSKAVNKGDKDTAIKILKGETYQDIRFRLLPKPELLKSLLKKKVLEGYRDYLKNKDPLEAIKEFESFRILSPIKWGNYGVNTINKLVEEILYEEGLISLNSPWYIGRPILITKNNYDLELFNGDIGIIMPDPERNYEPRAFFVGSDGTLRKFLPIRLPEHETVFAMTVHKSQGSEFDDVLFILPDNYVPIITRELIYTAITRARRSIEIWGSIDIIEKGIAQRIERSSGLRDALWEE